MRMVSMLPLPVLPRKTGAAFFNTSLSFNKLAARLGLYDLPERVQEGEGVTKDPPERRRTLRRQ